METSEHNAACSSTLPLLKDSKSTDKLELSTLLVRNTKLARVCVMIATFCSASALATFYGIFMAVIILSIPETALISLYAPLALCSVFQLLGGMLGDAVFGHYETIKYGFLCSMCGLAFMSYVAKFVPLSQNTYLVCLQIGSFIMSIGTGLLKFNVACFGVDQISVNHDHEIRTFFNYLQFSAYIGVLAGFKAFNLLPQKQVIFSGYVTSGAIMLVGLFIFLLPHKNDYHIISPTQKLRCRFFQIIINAMRRKR